MPKLKLVLDTTKTVATAAAAQTMPGTIGPMLPPPTTTEPDPFPDYPDLPACLDRRLGSATELDALRERLRAAELRVQELETENARLRTEVETLRAAAGAVS